MKIRWMLGFAGVSGLVFAALAAPSCAPSAEGDGTCGDHGNCDVTDAGKSEAGKPDSGVETGECDGTKSPMEAACVIASEYGVFVSEHGTDGETCGTKEAPCKSVVEGLKKAGGKRLYVCGKHDESVKLDSTVVKLEMYGGFSCADWSYDSAKNRAEVKPSDGSSALVIEGNNNGIAVHDMVLESVDATAPGASSIAVVVKDSKNVRFEGTSIKAGKGGQGAEGAAGAKGDPGQTIASPQLGALSTCGGERPKEGQWEKASACGSQGGTGGLSVLGNDGAPGSKGLPSTDVMYPNLGQGGEKGTATSKSGKVGGDGSEGGFGANGAEGGVPGSFTSSGYTPSQGTSGTQGYVGQGGGGGGGGWSKAGCYGPTGGAGGMGGCGGKGGSGGQGGGASVGLFVWTSEVTLEKCEVVSSAGGVGGKGGDGGDGGDGKPGGGGGTDAEGNMESGGKGGTGGNGGPGGSGTGGAGGPSYCVVHQGTAPTQNETTLTVGTGGEAGPGGKANHASATQAPSGSVGAAGEVFAL